MTNWNYRIVKHKYPSGIFYELHEVYYDGEANIIGCTVKPQAGSAESIDELIEKLWKMARDAYKSRKDILDYEKM